MTDNLLVETKWIVNQIINGHCRCIAIFHDKKEAISFASEMGALGRLGGVRVEYTIDDQPVFENASQAINTILKIQ